MAVERNHDMPKFARDIFSAVICAPCNNPNVQGSEEGVTNTVVVAITILVEPQIDDDGGCGCATAAAADGRACAGGTWAVLLPLPGSVDQSWGAIEAGTIAPAPSSSAGRLETALYDASKAAMAAQKLFLLSASRAAVWSLSVTMATLAFVLMPNRPTLELSMAIMLSWQLLAATHCCV